jgi:hypothetical protein
MIYSLSSVSIRVTKHIKELIQNSQISKALGKNIEIKVVISRIPKPDNLLNFKDKYCQTFETPAEKLFFLFSCPELELNEFLAINEPDTDEELVNNYVKLFYALDLDLAKDKIIAEIENVTSRILRLPPKEAEQSIVQLTTMYPNFEAYRAAMYFFRLKDDLENSGRFAEKILAISPNDEEAKIVLAKSYLRLYRVSSKNVNYAKKIINIIEFSYENNQLNYMELYAYVKVLILIKQYQKALKLALELSTNEQIPIVYMRNVCEMAYECAEKLGNNNLSNEIKEKIELLKEQELKLEDIPF